ncbi:MAG TPA: zeta toxin family protein [Chthoniobacterales bacterium]
MPLSPEELVTRYESRIRPKYQEVFVRQTHPVAMIIAGQPGAGKTETRKQLRERFGGPVVELDKDALREHYPNYRRIEQNDPQDAIHVASPAADVWETLLLQDAIDARAHIISESTLRHPESIVTFAQQLSQTYAVELYIVATRPEVAQSRLFMRYEQEIEQYGSGRYVPYSVSKASEDSMLNTIASVEHELLITRVVVVAADNRILYDTEERCYAYTTAAQSVLEDRQRPLMLTEEQEIMENWKTVFTAMDKRTAKRREYDAILEYGDIPRECAIILAKERFKQRKDMSDAVIEEIALRLGLYKLGRAERCVRSMLAKDIEGNYPTQRVILRDIDRIFSHTLSQSE